MSNKNRLFEIMGLVNKDFNINLNESQSSEKLDEYSGDNGDAEIERDDVESIKKLKELGYTVEKWSSWEGDKGKFKFSKGTGQWLGLLNTINKTINPLHGYYGEYLDGIAKEISYELVQ